MTASSLQAFLDLRSQVIAERVGDGGADVCAALTAQLDAAIADLGTGLESGAAVVALGGYGRREQCIWSDVDLMVLHDHPDPEPLVRQVLYPLWDADLKVGHAVRTVAENRDHAAVEFESLTSILSARLIAGDADLYGELEEMLVELIRKRPLASRLATAERERRTADPYPSMTTDVKDGRGGLRTHHGFWWERRRAVLLDLPVDEPSSEEVEARRTLLSIRNGLHAAAGRAQDRFLVDLREPAASWLDTDVKALATRFTAALNTGDRLADLRWPDLHAEQDPMVGFGRRIFGAVKSRFTASPEPAAPDRPLAIAVKAAARSGGAWFTSEEEASIADFRSEQWTAADRADFVKLLSAGARGRTIFGRLRALGWVDREIPEWSIVATAPQLAPFHDHPVGTHLWRTVDESVRLIESNGETRDVAEELGSTEELLLAAFLHDIGKARGGNHAEVGAAVAAGFLRRTGFGAATIGVVADIVRLHLLLSDTATRRDVSDLDVINDVAARVGDLRRLGILYLLTIADLRATGTTMWNEWRATLIRRLYQSVRQAIEVGGAPAATPGVDAIMAVGSKDLDRRLIEEHVAAMPDGYLDSTPPREVLWHFEVARSLDQPAVATVDPEDDMCVLVAGTDSAGFMLTVSRVFTANGIGVMDARFRTRADGMVLDTFHVSSDRTGDPIAAGKWDQVNRDLVAALAENRDIRRDLRERVEAYEAHLPDRNPVRVRVGVSGRYAVIEIKTPDRLGLLADIAEALYGEGLDVHLARIDTMGGEARDTFYVRRVGGAPIRDEAELAGLRGRLEDRLRG